MRVPVSNNVGFYGVLNQVLSQIRTWKRHRSHQRNKKVSKRDMERRFRLLGATELELIEKTFIVLGNDMGKSN